MSTELYFSDFTIGYGYRYFTCVLIHLTGNDIFYFSTVFVFSSYTSHEAIVCCCVRFDFQTVNYFDLFCTVSFLSFDFYCSDMEVEAQCIASLHCTTGQFQDTQIHSWYRVEATFNRFAHTLSHDFFVFVIVEYFRNVVLIAVAIFQELTFELSFNDWFCWNFCHHDIFRMTFQPVLFQNGKSNTYDW
ncbi:hypothetical protein D3C76_1139210 [compost metagenome]